MEANEKDKLVIREILNNLVKNQENMYKFSHHDGYESYYPFVKYNMQHVVHENKKSYSVQVRVLIIDQGKNNEKK